MRLEYDVLRWNHPGSGDCPGQKFLWETGQHITPDGSAIARRNPFALALLVAFAAVWLVSSGATIATSTHSGPRHIADVLVDTEIEG